MSATGEDGIGRRDQEKQGMSKNRLLTPLVASLAIGPGAAAAPAAPALEYAFTASVEVAPAVEQGQVGGGRRRFIAITGGKVEGPMLAGEVLPGGGDWQIIEGGLTQIEARYFLKTADGTVIEVTNPGVRVADPEVIEKLARGEEVPADAYYFRTTPRFSVSDGRYGWLRRAVFVARGVRRPDNVLIEFYVVR